MVVGNVPQVILAGSQGAELLSLGIWISSRPGEVRRGSSMAVSPPPKPFGGEGSHSRWLHAIK